MRMLKSPAFLPALVITILCLLSAVASARQGAVGLKAEDVMTSQELSDTGISNQSPTQRKAFNAWLNRYTATVFKVAVGANEKEPARPRTPAKSDCSPAIESTIAGDFNGWDGETVFKLDNGQIWEQAEYDYEYSYAFRPDVTIYETSSGCRMKVEDEDETILVRRIR